ncbi:MAG: DUF1294 domain-containing protein [Oscillospiraceae bacterium]
MNDTLWGTITIYLLLINLYTLAMMTLDKRRAITGGWRITEKNLLLTALIGGAFGGILGMLFLRHKIRKPKFYLGFPMFFCLHLVGLFLLGYPQWILERIR